jgi:hypothetical protein
MTNVEIGLMDLASVRIKTPAITPKKLDSICCPQCRETKADTLKQLRPIGEGDQELEKRLVREELT